MRRRGEDVHARLALFLEEAASGCEKQLSFRVSEPGEDGLPRQRTKTLNVKIPDGITQGQHIRLRGQGGPGSGGGEPGDLFVEIELAPHPLFSVTGKDIYLTLPISPWEAALGSEVPAPTLRGEINIRVPPGSRDGNKLRIKGKGLQGKKPGDMIVILQIGMPEQHSPAAEKLYSELAQVESGFDPRAKLHSNKGGRS